MCDLVAHTHTYTHTCARTHTCTRLENILCQLFSPGIYFCTGILNNYWKKRGIRNYWTGEKGGLGIPEKEWNMYWVLPRGNCKIPLDGWLSGSWWSSGCLVKHLG